jgi:hypothetical protein
MEYLKWHITGRKEFVANILEGAIYGKKKAVGRSGLQYLEQVVRNTGADSYIASCQKHRS